MTHFLPRALSAPLLLLALVACSVQSQPPAEPPVPATQGRFSLSADSTSNSVDPGGEVSGIPIRIGRSGGFAGEVSFELFGAPEGITGRFTPTRTAGEQTTLTLTVAATTPPGPYDLSVRGQSGQLSDAVEIPLFVTEATDAQPGFSLSLEPAALTLERGTTETVRVRVNRRDVTGPVGLRVSGEPAGVQVDIDTSGQDPRLRVTAQTRAVPGNYALTVRGASGDLTSQTQLGLSILGESSGVGRSSIEGRVRTANAGIPLASAEANALISQSAPPTSINSSISERPAYVPGQLLVQYHTGGLSTQTAREARADVRQRYGLTLLEAGTAGPALLSVQGDASVEAVAAALARDPDVRYAEPNYYLYPADVTTLPNDPDVTQQWTLPATGLPVAWQAAQGGAETVVAVLDSGFDLEHEDLEGRFLPGYDFCGLARGDCANAPTDADPSYGAARNSHGTLVAGVLGAHRDNGVGTAGAASSDNVKLLPIKLFNDRGTGATTQGFIQSIRWAVGLNVSGAPVNRNPARIINLSLGGNFESAIVQSALDEARARGALVVAAAGNSGVRGVLSPAAADGVLGVGATNRDFERACFSNYGVGANGPSGVDLVAPGGEAAIRGCDRGTYGLLSTAPGDRYESAIGTSFAAPLVAGAAALLLSQEPTLSAPQLETRLLESTYLGNAMNREEYGSGALRAERALGVAGPGDQVSVTASALDGESSALATVTLDLYGGSSPYVLDGLMAGRYRVEAAAQGLVGEVTLSLADDERREVGLELQP